MQSFGKILGVVFIVLLLAYIAFSIYRTVRDILDRRKQRKQPLSSDSSPETGNENIEGGLSDNDGSHDGDNHASC